MPPAPDCCAGALPNIASQCSFKVTIEERDSRSLRCGPSPTAFPAGAPPGVKIGGILGERSTRGSVRGPSNSSENKINPVSVIFLPLHRFWFHVGAVVHLAPTGRCGGGGHQIQDPGVRNPRFHLLTMLQIRVEDYHWSIGTQFRSGLASVAPQMRAGCLRRDFRGLAPHSSLGSPQGSHLRLSECPLLIVP